MNLEETIDARITEALREFKPSVEQLPIRKLSQRLGDTRESEQYENPAPSIVNMTSNAAAGPSALSTDLLLPAASLSVELSRGIWLVTGYATVSSQTLADGKQLALWNGTAAVELPNSRSGIWDCPAVNVYQGLALTSVVEVTSDRINVQILGMRNGASQISFGYPGGLVPAHRLTAVRLT